jgi:tetratricopeptide (TPR) repeat protein
VDAYIGGDIGLAMERAEASPGDAKIARALEDLKAFDAAYRQGLAHTQAKQVTQAIAALEKAEKADRALAHGKESRLGREVRKALGNLHTVAAAQAMGTDEELPQAAQHLRAAVAQDPQNEQAQQQLGAVAARAKDIYLRGYVAKDNDPDSARQAFKLVTQILPAADETAQKARRWLDKLEGRASREDG